MAASSNLATVTLIDTVLKDLGPASFPLNIQVKQIVKLSLHQMWWWLRQH